MAAGVEEIDGLEDGVVGDADHLDAIGLHALLDLLQGLLAVDLEGDVLHPGRGIDVAPHGRRIGDLEEGQHIALPGIEEHVHVGVGALVDGTWSSAMARMKSMFRYFRYHSTVCLASLQR
jgi:hypothetical protein